MHYTLEFVACFWRSFVKYLDAHETLTWSTIIIETIIIRYVLGMDSNSYTDQIITHIRCVPILLNSHMASQSSYTSFSMHHSITSTLCFPSKSRHRKSGCVCPTRTIHCSSHVMVIRYQYSYRNKEEAELMRISLKYGITRKPHAGWCHFH